MSLREAFSSRERPPAFFVEESVRGSPRFSDRVGLHRTLWSRHADFGELLFPATCCIHQQVIRNGSLQGLRSNPEEALPDETETMRLRR